MNGVGRLGRSLMDRHGAHTRLGIVSQPQWESIDDVGGTGQSHLNNLIQNKAKIIVIPTSFEALGMDANARRAFLAQEIESDVA